MSTPRGVRSTTQKLSKRELYRECIEAKGLAAKHITVSKMLAAELYRTNPDHPVFTDGTFTQSSMETIQLDVKVFETYEKLRSHKG